MGFFHPNFMLQLQFSHDDAAAADIHRPSYISPAPILPHGFLDGKRSSSMRYENGAGLYEETKRNSNGEDELSDDGGEKKRRLDMEQVKTLERSFELGSKLDPERKTQLARDLGLQPRQVAIWFQNRRARWKTKQLEKNYNLLKRQVEAARAENDALRAQNLKLHAEILVLNNMGKTEMANPNRGTEESSSNRTENSSETKIEISRNPAIESRLSAELYGSRIGQVVKEGSSSFYCSTFCGVDEQGILWPWGEHRFT